MLTFLGALDVHLLKAINAMAGHSVGLDLLVTDIALNHIAKGVVVMMLFWGLAMARTSAASSQIPSAALRGIPGIGSKAYFREDHFSGADHRAFPARASKSARA